MKKRLFLSLIILAANFIHAGEERDFFICCDDPIDGRGMPLSFLYIQDKCYEFQVEAAYLYWKAYSDGFDYLYTYTDNQTATGNTFESDATLNSADFSWKGSPRVSVGIAGTLWDSKATWTHYESSDSADFSEEVFQVGAAGVLARRLNLIWLMESTQLSDFASATQVHASGKLKYSTLDWVAGFSIASNQHYYFRPYFGAKAAWIRQYLTTTASNSSPADPLDFVQSNAQLDNTFRAIGLLFGSEARYRATDWFSFYADGALAILGGSFSVHQNQVSVVLEDTSFPVYSRSNFSRPALRPTMKIGVGIDLSYHFSRQNCRINLTTGYEINYWPYQNQWTRLFNANQEFKHPGDVVLQGAVIQGAVTF